MIVAPLPLIQFHRVTKRFHAVAALTDVSFDIAAGSFHAICGENGAGKSTLMKILSGVIGDYDGDVELDGRQLKLAGPRDAEARGISIIHQELNLVADLSAAANLFLGRELVTPLGLLDQRRMDREAAALFRELECSITPSDSVRKLRIGDQQLVEIAKALSLKSRILIMDEPTSALTETEVARLFRVISRLRAQGVTILYISHKMNEIFAHADAITVLRDGCVMKTLRRAETNPGEVTRLMVGREIAGRHDRPARTPGDVVLDVERLSLPWRGHPREWRLKDVSFQVRRGEVVGIAGLMGAGRTELLECLSGASAERPGGVTRWEGRLVAFAHPAEALAAGIALVTEDRKRFGIFPQLAVGPHLTLSSLRQCRRGGLVNATAERKMTDAALQRLSIKTSGRRAAIQNLSGGNQQKCVIGRALLTKPRLLLLDDPTRGVDVGAKAEIYTLIDELCAEGIAVVLTSSELGELITVCDRILVLAEGKLRGEFARDNVTEAKLLAAAVS
jgi:ABC-type sugar transport system ATPase subunit